MSALFHLSSLHTSFKKQNKKLRLSLILFLKTFFNSFLSHFLPISGVAY